MVIEGDLKDHGRYILSKDRCPIISTTYLNEKSTNRLAMSIFNMYRNVNLPYTLSQSSFLHFKGDLQNLKFVFNRDIEKLTDQTICAVLRNGNRKQYSPPKTEGRLLCLLYKMIYIKFYPEIS